MIGFTKDFMSILAVLLTILLVVLTAVHHLTTVPKGKNPIMHPAYRTMLACQLVTGALLSAVIIILYFSYKNFIPADSPGCLPHLSKIGVIASGVNPQDYAVKPPASFPAITYEAAIAAYHTSPNGLATGYFSWDGAAVTILNSDAYQLSSGAKPGTSWVFQDLSTASVIK